MQKTESVLFRWSAGWTVVGLASGLAYRELTRSTGFSGFTQLAVVHTHTLVLGTVVGLLLLAVLGRRIRHTQQESDTEPATTQTMPARVRHSLTTRS